MIITEITRRNIIESLILKGNISGRLGLLEFLERTWNLSEMDSTDSRFKTAMQDIWQHMINNNDWDDEFLFISYLNTLQMPRENFLHFLEQIVDPIVRSPGTQLEYVEIINGYLRHDGYLLKEKEKKSGSPIYNPHSARQFVIYFVTYLSEHLYS